MPSNEPILSFRFRVDERRIDLGVMMSFSSSFLGESTDGAGDSEVSPIVGDPTWRGIGEVSLEGVVIVRVMSKQYFHEN